MGEVEDLENSWLVGSFRYRRENPGSGGGVNGGGYNVKFHSLKEIFYKDSNPNDLEYGIGKTMSFMMMAESLI